jgi:tetratricopeptide (TPR) repeat protein
MIVKNESKIIIRLLKSVLPLIDSYCICDTGSTDNTIEVIMEFFKQQNILSGKIIQEPFKDFGYNRSYALKQCFGMDNADYILLLDADMVLEIDPMLSIDDFKNNLSYDAYTIFQGSPSFFYKNIRLIKNKPGISYWGVTHEYVNMPQGSTTHTILKHELFINDVGDGGCKQDKFLRDIRLLEKGLEENPNNDRYTFYLANSYKDAYQLDNAIKTYKKRIDLGGWHEEIWYSYYNMGKCYRDKGDMRRAINAWIDAYVFYPNRIENLYEIINYYRNNGNNSLAYTYYNLARYERNRKTDYDNLFLQKDIYDYKLEYELSIIGYYCNWDNYDLKKISMNLLAFPRAEEYMLKNVLSNYKFYSKQLVNDISIQNRKLQQIINYLNENTKEMYKNNNIDENEFVSSTPALCYKSATKELFVNTRFVNYRINEKGEYINKDKIETINVISIFEITDNANNIENIENNENNENNENSTNIIKKIDEYIMNYNKKYDNVYVGLEDVRMTQNKNKILYTANRGLKMGNMEVEYGIINLNNTDKVKSTLMKIKNQNQIEKNWVLFENAEEQIKMIYKWYPLTIGDIEEVIGKETERNTNELSPISKMIVTHEIETPHFFKWLRGSTNGVTINNEIWFLTHLVSYEDRRYYYHCMVVLDNNTMKLKKYSNLFTFEKSPVEYTLGMVLLDDVLLISYSIMDRQTKYIGVSLDDFDFTLLRI